MTDRIPPSEQPSARRLQRAGCWVVAIVLALVVIIFVARNIWHEEALDEDQATGANLVQPHTGKSYE